MIHLHKMMKTLKSMEVGLIDPSINNIRHSGTKSGNLEKDWFFTSTPRRLEIACSECKKQCQKKQHFKIHMIAHIWDPPDISSIDHPDGWGFAPEPGAAGPFMVEITPQYLCADRNIVMI